MSRISKVIALSLGRGLNTLMALASTKAKPKCEM